jgi:hypothetical protein
MLSPSRPIFFMLRCRRTSQFPSQICWHIPREGLEWAIHTRPASTNSQSSTPSGKTTSTAFAFPSQTPSKSTSRPIGKPQGILSPTNRRPTQFRTAERLSIWTAVKSIFGWKPTPLPYIPAPFNAINNPYRARKSWPPDFTTLHPKHQFHFEKTYRRRAKLKYARPTWKKGTKIVQYGLSLLLIGYWVFFLEVGDDRVTPFQAVSGAHAAMRRVERGLC